MVARLSSLLPYVSALALLMSCGPSESTSQQKIYGGNEVGVSKHLNVVAITDGDGIFCSGTALSPTLVITAAHCLEGENVNYLKVYVGNGSEGGDVTGQHTVKQIEVNPAYNNQDYDSYFDTGYLVLREPLTIPAESYVKVLTDKAEIAELLVKGAKSTLVGFGERKKKGYGVKYEVETPVKKVLNYEVTIGANGRDACQGDSGGPAFGQLKSGEWRVYGVTSRGGNCGNGGYWGLIHKNICWVLKASGETLDSIPGDYCKN